VGQLAKRDVDALEKLALLERILRRLGSGRTPIDYFRERRAAAQLTARVVAGDVRGNAEDPGSNRAATAIIRRRTRNLYERCLDEVVEILASASCDPR